MSARAPRTIGLTMRGSRVRRCHRRTSRRGRRGAVARAAREGRSALGPARRRTARAGRAAWQARCSRPRGALTVRARKMPRSAPIDEPMTKPGTMPACSRARYAPMYTYPAPPPPPATLTSTHRPISALSSAGETRGGHGRGSRRPRLRRSRPRARCGCPGGPPPARMSRASPCSADSAAAARRAPQSCRDSRSRRVPARRPSAAAGARRDRGQECRPPRPTRYASARH